MNMESVLCFLMGGVVRQQYAPDAVAGNDKSPHRAQAFYRSGESHAAAGEAAKAVEKLLPFRDKGEWQQIGGVSDRAVRFIAAGGDLITVPFTLRAG